MTTPTHQIYGAAGRPQMPGELRGSCIACGLHGVGVASQEWIKDTFMDHDKIHPGEIVCHACLFCFEDHNQALTERTGKEKLQRMRNYSHFVVDGQWYPLSKGQKAAMRELLQQRPTVAIIALSGQKHLIFRARSGWWQIEEQRIWPQPDLVERLLGPVEALYRAGASKAEIESGQYSQKTIMKNGLNQWREAELQLRPYRGGAVLALAVFLAQKDDDDDNERNHTPGEGS